MCLECFYTATQSSGKQICLFLREIKCGDLGGKFFLNGVEKLTSFQFINKSSKINLENLTKYLCGVLRMDFSTKVKTEKSDG